MSASTDEVGEPRAGALARRAADRALRRLLRLPPITHRYAVRRGVRIPMRDGVELLADRYVPDVAGPADCILLRAPYGRGYPLPLFFGQVFAARGYHVVVQSVRGTYGSGGVFEPAVNEAADGQDTVAWLRDQPWFSGRLATIGMSYLGLTQWALLQDPPAELKAAVVLTGPHDYSAAWATGTFAVDDFLGWSNGVANHNQGDPLVRRLRGLVPRRGHAEEPPAGPPLPLRASGRAVLGTGAQWYESWLDHSNRDDPYWDAQRFGDAMDRADVPILLINGWQDVFLDQTLQQYARLADRGVAVGLTIGPWTHARMLRMGAKTFLPEALQWFGTHLDARSAVPPRRDPVRLFVTGHGWVGTSHWPPAMPSRVLYLQPDRRLADEPPPADAPPSSFTYDPGDPTPTVGGRLLSPAGGQLDDTALANRHDVLTFTGAPLTEDLYVIGSPRVELVHSADNPHVDVLVRVSSVAADGRSTNISDGYRRLASRPAGHIGHVTVELDAIAHRFSAGTRLRVLIAGGSYPRFAPNPGTGEPLSTADRLVPATHRIHHGSGGACRLVLPADHRLPQALRP
ncbi:CocE/NonD family hydrolase [Mycobacterium sp. MYCO198283]|uniref:CocE/NonD family hydrolase n=1 Tax=Mycobacterium sp. MYCO198283 TaxID=2883505 RepID=UPI001E5C4B85|nr:CocE/NonD family hydrolase [Mycobacterium sp. MYCO198283]MCG5430913.1 CocE/NonD family hydrolase [Mycobacterium sp. MYCO198283]